MTLRWLASIYDSTESVIFHTYPNDIFDLNHISKSVTIQSTSITEGFKMFVQTDAYRNFLSNILVEHWAWYYYDDYGTLHNYAPYDEDIEDIKYILEH